MIDIPDGLAASQAQHNGAAGRDFVAGLPERAAAFLDRERARAWTFARVLQNSLWEVEDGRPPVPEHLEIGRRLRERRS